MKKKKIIAAMMSAAMLFSVVTPYLPAQAEERNAVLQETDAEAERETINFNTDWHYYKGDAAGADQITKGMPPEQIRPRFRMTDGSM